MAWNGNETWYSVVGELDSGPTPVIICHGGPGAAHDYTEPIAELSRFGRGCVLYDQVGCGKSTHLADAPAEFWSPQLFKDELVELAHHLGVAGRYEHVVHAAAAQPGDDVRQVHLVPHQPGRQVRHRPVAVRDEALGQVQGRLEALGR